MSADLISRTHCHIRDSFTECFLTLPSLTNGAPEVVVLTDDDIIFSPTTSGPKHDQVGIENISSYLLEVGKPPRIVYVVFASEKRNANSQTFTKYLNRCEQLEDNNQKFSFLTGNGYVLFLITGTLRVNHTYGCMQWRRDGCGERFDLNHRYLE